MCSKSSFDLKFLLIVCSFSLTNKIVICWERHEVCSLKLLQVVHRHGDRTLNRIYPNDPFSNLSKYWPEGIGELTKIGKKRMFKLGQFIRNEYEQFLGPSFSPQEVYARSSAKKRCLESLSCLLAGAYPPNNDILKWNNGTDSVLGSVWQPISIFTFPEEHMNEDRLLRTEALCPKAIQEMNRLENSQLVQNVIRAEKGFLQELSALLGFSTISTLLDAKNVYDNLYTEHQLGYKWSDFNRWSLEYEQNIFRRLLPLTELLWITEWNSTVVQRVRAGPLIQELNKNIKNLISEQNSKKVFLYSTHDSMIAVLMHSLQVFNNKIIPLSATLFFELHENPLTHKYFVKLYYFNETLTEKSPHLLRLPGCGHLKECPIETFLALTQRLIPDDWEKECGISKSIGSSLILSLNMSILILNVILVSILVIVLLNNCVNHRKPVYESLE